MGGNNMNKDVPILFFVLSNKPKKANNGTMRISAPPPTKPAARPDATPIIVNPNK